MARKHNQILGGTRFTRLVVIDLATMIPRPVYRCQCDCGKIVTVRSADLRSGNTKSCECLKLEQLAKNRSKIDRSKNIKHGMYRTPTWNSWFSMLNRCRHPEKTYLRGKNIRVCDRWESFGNFFEDMGERPTGLSLDRINNAGNYEPGNCRWATRSQQNANQRKIGKGEMRKLCNFSTEELLEEIGRRENV